MDKISHLAQIQRLIEEFRRADVRGKRKPARIAAHLATQVVKSGDPLSLEELDLLIEALGIGAKHHGWPDSWRACQAKLRLRKREMANIPEPVTLFEKVKTLDVEMGSVMVIDPQRSLEDDYFGVRSEAYRLARENGEFFDVALGGDGPLKVRLRYVDCAEPELTSDELRRVIGATDRAFLRTDSKRLRAWGGGEKFIEIDAGANDLLSSFYALRPESNPQLICVCCDSRGARPGYFESAIEL